MNKGSAAYDINDRYQRAEQLLSCNLERSFRNTTIHPFWISDTTFIYRHQVGRAHKFLRVDCLMQRSVSAFNHAQMAEALSKYFGVPIQEDSLPISYFHPAGGRLVEFEVYDQQGRFLFPLDNLTSTIRRKAINVRVGGVTSPDGNWVITQSAGNLYCNNSFGSCNSSVALTKDGSIDFGYGCYNPFGLRDCQSGSAPVLHWSPDSRYVVAQRVDVRSLQDCFITQYAAKNTDGEGRLQSVISTYPFAAPSDPSIPVATTYIFDLNTGEGVQAKMRPVPLIETLESETFVWGDDGLLYQLVFTRGQKRVTLIAINPVNGAVREIIEETSDTFVSGPNQGYPQILQILASSQEVIYYSEMDGYASLYLYDLVTGKVKRRLSSNYNVTCLNFLDCSKRVAYFSAGSEREGINPYHQKVYRVGLDDGAIKLLTPEPGFHDCPSSMSSIYRGLFCKNKKPKGFSPSGDYFIDSIGCIDQPSRTLLRRSNDGECLMRICEAEIDSGTKEPLGFCVKASDGDTSLWGAVFRPSYFTERDSYPVILSIYGAPQFSFSPKFRDETYTYAGGNHWALAELGFIVVVLDPRGTPMRGKIFQDVVYGHLDNGGGLDDHIAALKQLISQYSWMDSERIGVTGISGGGYAAANAMLSRPDFFKVGVAISGNHDQQLFHYSWAETYHGVVERVDYEALATRRLAAELNGRLLLIHGDSDSQVNPSNSIQLFAALIDNKKVAEFKLLPNLGHFLPEDPYLILQTWDYFVEHLMGENPPLNKWIGAYENTSRN